MKINWSSEIALALNNHKIPFPVNGERVSLLGIITASYAESLASSNRHPEG
jgi:hypothetical protein